jgi:mycofactocin precursor
MSQQAAIDVIVASATQSVDAQPNSERTPDRVGGEAFVTDELLVEEISIDGMCGVY